MKQADAQAIVFGGEHAILDDYAGRDAILAKLHDAFLAFDADPSASVAVLWGEGGAFCAGLLQAI